MNRDGSIFVPEETLKKYGINLGDRVVSMRGSNIAMVFIVRGPIIEEARKHSDISVYE